jgi:hypothetical protein
VNGGILGAELHACAMTAIKGGRTLFGGGDTFVTDRARRARRGTSVGVP